MFSVSACWGVCIYAMIVVMSKDFDNLSFRGPTRICNPHSNVKLAKAKLVQIGKEKLGICREIFSCKPAPLALVKIMNKQEHSSFQKFQG